jgi:hypothetical protein
MVKELPLLILLVLVNVYILFKIPALTASIFSGSTGGHDGGLGLVTAAIVRSI